MKRLAGSKWDCSRQTQTLTYKMYIEPCLLYCCKPFMTAAENVLGILETTQNQALRLITGGVKSTPINSMILLTGMKPFRKTLEERNILLYEKLIRSSDDYWSTYSNSNRQLKTQWIYPTGSKNQRKIIIKQYF